MISIAETTDLDEQGTQEVEEEPGVISNGHITGPNAEVHGEFRLAWLWAEGWRARLRKSGDVVEKCRWEWRWDDLLRQPNAVPSIVARVPGVSAMKGAEVKRDIGGRKSVHWA